MARQEFCGFVTRRERYGPSLRLRFRDRFTKLAWNKRLGRLPSWGLISRCVNFRGFVRQEW